MCLFARFILQNHKKIFKSRSKVLRTQHFPVHNNPFTHSPSTNIFFAKITNIDFIGLLAPFNVQNVKKPLEWIWSFEDVLYNWSKMTHLPQPSLILKKTINLSFMYLFVPFILVNYKKNS